MQIYYNQLDSKLKDNLKPIYIIAGSEIYQEELCLQKIIKAAKKESFFDHEVMYVEKSFDWDSFNSSNSNLSLFSSKKITSYSNCNESFKLTWRWYFEWIKK